MIRNKDNNFGAKELDYWADVKNKKLYVFKGEKWKKCRLNKEQTKCLFTGIDIDLGFLALNNFK